MKNLELDHNSELLAGCFPLELRPLSRRFSVAPALGDELANLILLTEKNLPGLRARASVIRRVHSHSNSVLAVTSHAGVIGSFALLTLNEVGFDQLVSDTLDIANPESEILSRPNERAAALYVWAICLPGAAVGALGNVMQWLRQPSYRDCAMYARPATLAGRRIMVKTGFEPINKSFDGAPLWIYRSVDPTIQPRMEK